MPNDQQQNLDQKPAGAKAKGPTEDPGEIRFYRVTEQIEIPMGRAGTALFRKGKVLSSKGYDIRDLEDAGVKLERIPEPGWHRKAIEEGQRRREARGDRPYPPGVAPPPAITR